VSAWRKRASALEPKFAALRERVGGAEHRRERIVGAAGRIEVVAAGVVRQPRDRAIPLVASSRAAPVRLASVTSPFHF